MKRSRHGSHPMITRRTAVRAGALGLLGLGMNHLEALRAAAPTTGSGGGTAKSCIYLFLSGGLAQHESFDLKPDAPDGIRGEFRPIATRTPGIGIDLESRGLLDTTLIVMGSELGRTPRLSTLTKSYGSPGRDHWGAVQNLWFAGGGVRGGTVVGSSDKIGAYPAANPQTPENMAATIYHALGIPSVTAWRDDLDRPHHIYQGSPIPGLI